MNQIFSHNIAWHLLLNLLKQKIPRIFEFYPEWSRHTLRIYQIITDKPIKDLTPFRTRVWRLGMINLKMK